MDYTGPATGDFRALRPDDSAGTMVFNPASAQHAQIPQAAPAPRALPPGPLALPPGPTSAQASAAPPGYAEDYAEPYYSDQQRYSEPRAGRRRLPADGYGEAARSYNGGQYAEAGYAEQPQYAEQPSTGSSPSTGRAGLRRAARYAEQPQYAEQGYAQPGYQDRSYGDQPGYGSQPARLRRPSRDTPSQGYADQGYSEHRSGYGYSDRDYAAQGYTGTGYDSQDYSGQYADQGYPIRAYPQDYPRPGLPRPGVRQGQGYGGDQGYGAPSPAGSDRSYPLLFVPACCVRVPVLPSYQGQRYDSGSYQGEGYATESYPGRGHDSSGPGYDSSSTTAVLRERLLRRPWLPGA